MADYTLAIKIDDNDLNKAIAKLQAVFKNIDISGTGSRKQAAAATLLGGGRSPASKSKGDQKKSMKGIDGIKKVLGSINKKQAAVTGMSFAVGGIFGLLTDISPLLQSSLKLLSTGIMLMLRPIADFIGLILRPIMVLLLQTVIIPFYKTVYPWFQSKGLQVGKDVATIFDPNATEEEKLAATQRLQADILGVLQTVNPLLGTILDQLKTNDDGEVKIIADISKWFEDTGNNIAAAGKYITDAFAATGAWFTSGIKQLQDAWGRLTGWITGSLVPMLTEAWHNLVGWVTEDLIPKLTEGWENLLEWLNTFTEPLREVWDSIVTSFREIFQISTLEAIWEVVGNFFASLGSSVSVLLPLWNNIVEFFAKLRSDAVGWVFEAWKNVTQFFANIGSDTTSWVFEAWTNFTQFFSNIGSDVTSWVKDAWDNVTSFFMKIADMVKSIWDRLNSFWKSILGARSSGGGGGGGVSGYEGLTPQQKQDKYHGRNQVASATGNIITEPIVGMGLNSGRGYTFGESGSEVVTPVKDSGSGMMGGGRNIIINAQVSSEGQLNALISKVKQELLVDQRRISVI